MKLCAASCAASSLPAPAGAQPLKARLYAKARLVDERGDPIRAAALKPGVNYVFDYPFAATP